MNKVFFFAFFFAGLVSINAQEFGFHFGVNYGTVLDKDGDIDISENLDFSGAIGLNIGIDFQKKVSKNLFFQTGLAFTQIGYTSDRMQTGPLGASARDVKLDYLQIPLNITVAAENKQFAYITGGFYLATLIGGKYELIGFPVNIQPSDEIKGLDLGANLAVGIRIKKIAVQIGYDLGLLNVSNSTTETSIRKMRSLNFKLFYWTK